MYETQTVQTRTDERSRCRDRSGLSIENEKRFREANAGFIGQFVFLPGGQFIGRIIKLFRNPYGHVSQLGIRTARLFGRYRMAPIASVSDVTSLRIRLSLNLDQFLKLPGFPSDFSIAEDINQALWKDVLLRDMDYHEIDVRVRDGFITLNGHVTTSMNQWRAETVVMNIPGVSGVKSYLISDDKLTLKVAEVLGQIEKVEQCKFYAKVENGLAVLVGEAKDISVREQAEQRVAAIPWVRGVINEIHVSGIVHNSEDQRFLQPLIGNALLFKDALSAIIRKVVINPHNRRVVAVVVLVQFPDPLRQESNSEDLGRSISERMVVLPARLIFNLTRSSGSIRINSNETTQFDDYDPTRYYTPDTNWLPPYPYCNDEVLFLADEQDTRTGRKIWKNNL